jgi:CCR4-NOT transcription complex subunit 2
MRLQTSNLSSQQQLSAQQQTQQQQDDLFSQSSQLPSSQGTFRFGTQNAVGQASQANNSSDDFPPLSRNANGDIGQDRNSNLPQNFGFGGQANGLGAANSTRNGLLNVLNVNRNASHRVASPGSLSGQSLRVRGSGFVIDKSTAVSTSRSPIDTGHQGLSGVTEKDVSKRVLNFTLSHG